MFEQLIVEFIDYKCNASDRSLKFNKLLGKTTNCLIESTHDIVIIQQLNKIFQNYV